jgi:SAM-dependent methyltransferase
MKANLGSTLVQLQTSNSTGFRRYSEIFQTFIEEFFPQASAPRVLVFGCSSGQELQTIRYFWPSAQIDGCDIDEEVLKKARQTCPDANVFASTEDALLLRGPYDLICANSVFCRHPLPTQHEVGQAFPFSIFEYYTDLLAKLLRANGHLMMYNCNYFFHDTTVYKEFTPIVLSRLWSAGFVPRLDCGGEIVARPHVLEGKLRRYTVTPRALPTHRSSLAQAVFRKSPQGAVPVVISSGARLRPTPELDMDLPPLTDTAPTYRPHYTIRVDAERNRRRVETWVTNVETAAWRFHGSTEETLPSIEYLTPADIGSGV